MLALIYCGGGSSHFSNIEPLFQPELTPTPTPKQKKKSNIFYVCRSLSEGLKTKLSFFEGTSLKKKIESVGVICPFERLFV